MRHAIELGVSNLGNTGPNPSVGCVIVKDGAIISEGFTQNGGRPHAEYNALEKIGFNAEGCDIYVSLEPCAHLSERGPSCSLTIIKAKPKRVIIALIDQDPRTKNNGVKMLESAGIIVEVGLLEAEAKEAHKEFLSRF